MSSLFHLGCLLPLGIFSGAQAAVVFMSLEDQELKFHSGDNDIHRISLDFVPGEGKLWLMPGSHVSYTGWLVSDGPIRVVTTIDPPPNIGGLVRAMDAGSIIGAGLGAPAGWYGGEPAFQNGQPVPGDRFHVLVEGGFTPPPSEFYKEKAYIGLEFEIEGQIHYGWLSTELAPGNYPWNSRPASNLITGFAYETQAGVPITAGVIPEPGIPLLSTIGIGALCLRRRTPSKHRDGPYAPSPNDP